MSTYQLNRTGPNVKELLDKIDNLGEATTTKSGLMSATDKTTISNLDDYALTNLEIEALLT